MKKISIILLLFMVFSTKVLSQVESSYSPVLTEMALSGNGQVLAIVGRTVLDTSISNYVIFPIDIFDTQTGELIKSIKEILPGMTTEALQIEGVNLQPYGIGLNYNGTLLSYITRRGNADVVDIQTEEQVMALQTGGAAEAGSTNWSRGNNNLVANFGIGTSRVFDADLTQQLARNRLSLPGGYETVGIAISDNGEFLAESIQNDSGAYLAIWDIPSSSVETPPRILLEDIGSNSISWSPNNISVASNLRGGVDIGNINTGEVYTIFLTNPDEVIISVAWSPDGTKIAGGSRNNMVWIWDVATGQIIGNYPTEFAVTSVAWSPDSQRLYHTGGSAGAYINGLPMADYIAQENSALPKQFTRYIWAIAPRAVILFRLPTV
jgi:WD40 repeat protein